jgi:hypothetical protein
MRDADDVALKKTMSELLPNVISYGLGVVALLFVGRWLNFVGLLGLVFYAVIFALDALRLVFTVGSGVVLLFSRTMRPGIKSWAATALQTVEAATHGVYTVILYSWFSPF